MKTDKAAVRPMTPAKTGKAALPTTPVRKSREEALRMTPMKTDKAAARVVDKAVARAVVNNSRMNTFCWDSPATNKLLGAPSFGWASPNL